jgi:hypothetical protein
VALSLVTRCLRRWQGPSRGAGIHVHVTKVILPVCPFELEEVETEGIALVVGRIPHDALPVGADQRAYPEGRGGRVGQQLPHTVAASERGDPGAQRGGLATVVGVQAN